jgi:hypothetical protein
MGQVQLHISDERRDKAPVYANRVRRYDKIHGGFKQQGV